MRILASNLGIPYPGTQWLVVAALLLLSGVWATAAPAHAEAVVEVGQHIPALSMVPDGELRGYGWVADPWPWQAMAEGAGPTGVVTTWCSDVEPSCHVRQHHEIVDD